MLTHELVDQVEEYNAQFDNYLVAIAFRSFNTLLSELSRTHQTYKIAHKDKTIQGRNRGLGFEPRTQPFAT